MPDGMTPENSYNQFKIGGPTRLPGNEGPIQSAKTEFNISSVAKLPGVSEQLKAAQEFDPTGAKGQLKASNEFSRPRMQVGAEDDRDPNKDRMSHELRMQEMFGERGGYLVGLMGGLRKLKEMDSDTGELDHFTTTLINLKDQLNGVEFDPSTQEINNDGNFTNAEKGLENSITELKSVFDKKIASNEKIDGKLKNKVERYINKATLLHKDYTDTSEANGGGRKEKLINVERERLADSYKNVVHKSLDELNALSTYLEKMRNPYPYDSRWSIQFFDQGIETINDSLRNKERFNKEGLALLKVLKRDFVWASSCAKVTEAMGPAFETYFDGEMELSRIRSSHTEITSEDWSRVFDKNSPGQNLSDSERQLASNLLGKSKELKFTTKEDGKYIEKLGIREVAVELQDRYGVLLYKLTGVGQKNLECVTDIMTMEESGPSKEAGEHYSDTDKVTFEFLSEVFNVESVFNPLEYMKFNSATGEFAKDTTLFENTGKTKWQLACDKAFKSILYKDKGGVNKTGYKVKQATLNPFCMNPRSDEIADRTYKARVREIVDNWGKYDLMLKKWRFELKEQRITEDDLTRLIQEEAVKIFDITNQRLLNWENFDEESPYTRLTDTVSRIANDIEHGTLSTGELGWGWRYEDISPYKIVIEEGTGKESILVGGKLDGEKINLYKDETDPEVWDILTKKILFKQTKLGRDGITFYIESGVKKEVKLTGLTQGEWDSLSDQDKEKKHQLHEFSPDEWGYFSSKIIDIEPGNQAEQDQISRMQTKVDGSQFMVVRKSEIGTIYDAHDLATVMFIARHIVDYDNMADTRSSIFPPTVGWFRNLWEEQPPYWRPKIEDMAPHDTALKQLLGIEGDRGILSKGNLFEKQYARGAYSIGKNGRGQQFFGRYNPIAAEFVQNNVWAFVTPFLEKPGDPTSDHLVIPVFLPTHIKDISFWRMTSLEKASAKLRKNIGKSIWHERLKGKKMSEFNWQNMDKFKFSWSVVTNDQMERWLGPLTTPHEFNRMTADEVNKHYKPGGVGEKESGKRGRLGGRAGIAPEGVLRATVLAQAKIIGSMRMSGVAGHDVNIELFLKSKLNDWQGKWIDPWVNTELDMPYEVRGCTNYGGTSAQTMLTTFMQMKKLAKSMVQSSNNQQNDVHASASEVMTKFGY